MLVGVVVWLRVLVIVPVLTAHAPSAASNGSASLLPSASRDASETCRGDRPRSRPVYDPLGPETADPRAFLLRAHAGAVAPCLPRVALISRLDERLRERQRRGGSDAAAVMPALRAAQRFGGTTTSRGRPARKCSMFSTARTRPASITSRVFPRCVASGRRSGARGSGRRPEWAPRGRRRARPRQCALPGARRPGRPCRPGRPAPC